MLILPNKTTGRLDPILLKINRAILTCNRHLSIARANINPPMKIILVALIYSLLTADPLMMPNNGNANIGIREVAANGIDWNTHRDIINVVTATT